MCLLAETIRVCLALLGQKTSCQLCPARPRCWEQLLSSGITAREISIITFISHSYIPAGNRWLADSVLLGNVFIVSGNSFRQSALVLLVKYKSCFADAFRAQIIQTFNFMYPCTIKWLSLKLIPALEACGLFWMTWEQLVTGQGFSAVSLYSSVRACWQAEWGHRHAFLHIRERAG